DASSASASYALSLHDALPICEMTSPDGAFYSSQDADSEGVEGKFYVWHLDEIISALGEHDGKIFNLVYGVTQRGNFEERNILHLDRKSTRLNSSHSQISYAVF